MGKAEESKKGRNMGKILMGLAAVGVLACAYFFVDKKTIFGLMQWLEAYQKEAGVQGQILFVVMLAVCTVCMIPCTPFELCAGVLWGFWWGWVLAVTGKMIGNVGAFTLGRTLCREWVQREVMPKYTLLRALSASAKNNPLKTCFFLRAAYVPLMVKNYGLAVLDVTLLQAMTASICCGPAYSLQSVYLGSTAVNLMDVLEGKSGAGKSFGMTLVMGGVGIAASVGVLAQVRKEMNKLLKEQENSEKKD